MKKERQKAGKKEERNKKDRSNERRERERENPFMLSKIFIFELVHKSMLIIP